MTEQPADPISVGEGFLAYLLICAALILFGYILYRISKRWP